MKILSIETSCDETGISILEGKAQPPFGCIVLGNALASQIDLHAQYGGVFPTLAKRAHAEKFVPLLIETLTQADLLQKNDRSLSDAQIKEIEALTLKEKELKEALIPFLSTYRKPDIDYIAVTTGPGLEPALWVGINAAKVLASIWNIPFIPINHMEGHVAAELIEEIPATTLPTKKHFHILQNVKMFAVRDTIYPALALLVSGGHTELVLMKTSGSYEKIGQTRDDAVGEAFDKVARMLSLSYPGGPEISKRAAAFRTSEKENGYTFPRPMLHSKDYDFSFSGIKTAVLYTVQKETTLSEEKKAAIACAFEDAVIEVLIKKTMRAVEEYQVHTLIVGGGVAGNTYLQKELHFVKKDLTMLFPGKGLSTDNALMIGIAAYLRIIGGKNEILPPENAIANGNLSITEGGYRK